MRGGAGPAQTRTWPACEGRALAVPLHLRHDRGMRFRVLFAFLFLFVAPAVAFMLTALLCATAGAVSVRAGVCSQHAFIPVVGFTLLIWLALGAAWVWRAGPRQRA
jgi:hypothetical protein